MDGCKVSTYEIISTVTVQALLKNAPYAIRPVYVLTCLRLCFIICCLLQEQSCPKAMQLKV